MKRCQDRGKDVTEAIIYQRTNSHMETLTDMVNNDSHLPACKILEGNMNTETVRIILIKNLSKKETLCQKKASKICGKERNFMRQFSKNAGNKASQRGGESD